MHAASLRFQLEKEYGYTSVRVLCPLEKDAGVLRKTDLHSSGEEEITEAMNASDIVIAIRFTAERQERIFCFWRIRTRHIPAELTIAGSGGTSAKRQNPSKNCVHEGEKETYSENSGRKTAAARSLPEFLLPVCWQNGIRLLQYIRQAFPKAKI